MSGSTPSRVGHRIRQHTRPFVQGQVNMCVSLHEVSPSVLCVTASACGGVCGTTGADIAVGGRGVSVQAAGYPIVSGLPLHPFPSNLPSSQHQGEVSRGQAGPSLYHYPSITCHPPSADNRTFPPSLFTLHSHHRPRLFMISHPSSFFLLLWFSHLLTLHLFPHSLFFIGPLFISFCTFDSKAFVAVWFSSVIFSHGLRKLRGLSLWDLLLWLQLISRLLRRYRTPTAAFTDRPQIELIFFQRRNSIEFLSQERVMLHT